MPTVDCKSVITSLHALKRMISRSISSDEIKEVLNKGEIIKEYPDDMPYPSMLIYKEVNAKQIHIVTGRNSATGECVIITVYIADEEIWEQDYKTKKSLT